MSAASSRALATIALLAFARASHATGPDGQCSLTPLPKARETAFDLAYPDPRYHELTLEAGYWATSFPIHSSLVLSAMYSIALFDQRVHFGVRAGATLGGWGPEDRGSYAFSLGGRFAVDFARAAVGLVDFYALAQADALLFAARGDAVVRPAAGLGIRLMRAIAVEATFEPAISAGAAFSDGSAWSPGFGIGLSFDLCSELALGCSSKQAKPTDEDLTRRLYDAARALPSDQDRAALCAAVAIGLDAERYFPHDDLDATAAFLKGVRDNVKDPALRTKLDGLVQMHEGFRAQLVKSRNDARKAARAATHLAENCSYAPYPVELRDAFACLP